jgi:hypothetical protein
MKILRTEVEGCAPAEVITAINSGLIRHFTDVPVPCRTEEVALAWIRRMNLTGECIQRSYDAVPVESRTSEFMMLAARHGCAVLKDVTPGQFPEYRELARMAVSSNIFALKDVDPRFCDEAMLKFTQGVFPEDIHKIARSCDWIWGVMPDKLLNKIALHDSLFAFDIPHDRMSKPLHRYIDLSHLSWRPGKTNIIRTMGRLDVLAAQVREGEWFEHKLEKPSSLEQAVIGLGKGLKVDSDHEASLLAYVMSHPIADVVPAMKGNRMKKLLLEMYPAEALEPFLKNDVGLRGAMLEGEMGL